MGAVCAAVYLLTIIIFIPFPFYKDIVAATSGGGNKEYVVERRFDQTGRSLHRFPHNKVRIIANPGLFRRADIVPPQVGVLSVCNLVPTISRFTRNWRWFIRHPVATQAFHTSLCFNSYVSGLFRRLRSHECCGSSTAWAVPRRDGKSGLAILCIYGCNCHILPEQYQYFGRHKWHWGISIIGHRLPLASQWCPISLRGSEYSKSSPFD